ncbi:Tetraspanin-11 [Nymphon striatum]|nr:Tetraspanin-11 [Nymphon striatum]
MAVSLKAGKFITINTTFYNFFIARNSREIIDLLPEASAVYILNLDQVIKNEDGGRRLWKVYEVLDVCRQRIDCDTELRDRSYRVGAITIMAVGIWTLLDKSYLENFLGTNLYKSSASILIAMGVTVLLISFLGCLGAIREIKCMLLTYFIILFLIFIILLIGGVLAYVFRDKVENTVKTEMMKAVHDYGNDDTRGKVITDSWDSTQRKVRVDRTAENPKAAHQETTIFMSWQLFLARAHPTPQHSSILVFWVIPCQFTQKSGILHPTPSDFDDFLHACWGS